MYVAYQQAPWKEKEFDTLTLPDHENLNDRSSPYPPSPTPAIPHIETNLNDGKGVGEAGEVPAGGSRPRAADAEVDDSTSQIGAAGAKAWR